MKAIACLVITSLCLATVSSKVVKLRTNTAGIQIIQKFEGYMPCKYDDGVGVETIGYGHTKTVKSLPECIDSATAEALFESDLKEHEDCVELRTKAPMNDNQFSAVTSLIFNVGCGNYTPKTSTLLRKINTGDYLGASAEFPKWNKAGGKVSRGLIARRKAEQWLFNS